MIMISFNIRIWKVF